MDINPCSSCTFLLSSFVSPFCINKFRFDFRIKEPGSDEDVEVLLSINGVVKQIGLVKFDKQIVPLNVDANISLLDIMKIKLKTPYRKTKPLGLSIQVYVL